MTDAAAEFQKVKGLHPDAVLLTEGGNPVVFLPKFSFRAAAANVVMDLLLVPFFHTGYATRVFFERQIAERGANWRNYRVTDREWWAPSFNNVPASLPWTAILCAHLRDLA